MTKNKRVRKAKPTAATAIPRKAADPRRAAQPTPRANSKQAEVLGMLRQPQGTTILDHHEGDRMAAALGPWVFRRGRA